jgi:thiamine kinase-like enzyme
MRGTRTRILKKYNRRRSRCYSKKSKRHTRKNIYSKTYKKIQKGGLFCDKERTELAQANRELEQANRELEQAKKEINLIIENKNIVLKYEQICKSTYFKHRVTHHDTKISNVLFNEKGKGLCVIDLDTVMGGLAISDLGDMFRTYLSPGNEEETDLDSVLVRPAFYHAIVEGYLEKMSDHLTSEEKAEIPFAGEFLIYMQALRFLTDYLNNDVYYGISYELNNYNRTINQLHLLDSYRKILS